MFFPVPFMSDTKSIRLGTFIDSGALNDSFSLTGYRTSAGLSGEWLSPFGALAVSAAYPINLGTYTYQPIIGPPITQPDQTQYFQFNFGQNF
jgi:outer membrane protein insertion porin family